MSSCSCEPKRQLPIAIIRADSGPTGGISRIRNISEWNETPWANILNRQVRWTIFKNGYNVSSSPWLPYYSIIDFAGVRHTPSVSNGIALNFEDATNDVIAFLRSKYISVFDSDRLEIGLEIVNGNNERSEMSNLILLPRNVGDVCCEDINNYTLTIGGIEHCGLVTASNFDYCMEYDVAPTTNFEAVDFDNNNFN